MSIQSVTIDSLPNETLTQIIKLAIHDNIYSLGRQNMRFLLMEVSKRWSQIARNETELVVVGARKAASLLVILQEDAKSGGNFGPSVRSLELRMSSWNVTGTSLFDNVFGDLLVECPNIRRLILVNEDTKHWSVVSLDLKSFETLSRLEKLQSFAMEGLWELRSGGKDNLTTAR